jgi:hypothetical protein
MMASIADGRRGSPEVDGDLEVNAENMDMRGRGSFKGRGERSLVPMRPFCYDLHEPESDSGCSPYYTETVSVLQALVP